MKHEIINNVVGTKIIDWGEIKGYEFNSLKSADNRDITKLKAAIINSGFNFPFFIWHNHNYVIDGKGRDIALNELESEGYVIPQLPIVEIIADSIEQAKKLVLQASSIHGEITKESFEDFVIDLDLQPFDFEMFDLDIDGLDALIPEEIPAGLTDDDEVPEPPMQPVTKLGDVWSCGKHRVMCGDSTSIDAVEKLMDGNKADMVFTDPPYGVSYASKNEFLNSQDKGNRIQEKIKNDHMSLEETSDFILQAFCNIKLSLADRSCYYITAPQGGDLLMMMMMMMKAGLPLRHCLIWVKNNHVLGRTDYNYKHEPILYGWDKVHDFYGEGDHKFSTWEIKKPHKNDLHPTMKPIELIENACLNSTKKGNYVLDLFGGSGSTLIACEKTNRINYSMELDERYCDVIVKRWQDYTGKLATLESTGELFNDLAGQQ